MPSRHAGGRRRVDGTRGFLLVTSLSVIIFLTLSSASLLVNGVSQSNLSLRVYNRASALQLAQAAVNQAGLNLRTTETSDDVLSGTLTTGTFQIESQQPLANSVYQVTARGTSQLETRRIEAFYKVASQSVFQFPLFGDRGVQMSGSMTTDSYDSRNGAYDSHQHNHRGNVGTNSTAVGSLDMSGSSLLIDGQLETGPNVADPTALVTGFNASRITGGTSPASDGQDVAAMAATIPMTAVTVPGGLTCADTQFNSHDIVTLSPTGGPLGNGSYCYHNLTIEGGAELTATGPVKVYLSGTLTIVGDTEVGVAAHPTWMIFYMAAGAIGTIEGTLEGSSEFYGGIYAPDADIAIGGNTKIFGAIAAENVYVAGSAEVHYDEAMAQMTGGPGYGSATLSAWREL